jgi:hypothetical protein
MGAPERGSGLKPNLPETLLEKMIGGPSRRPHDDVDIVRWAHTWSSGIGHQELGELSAHEYHFGEKWLDTSGSAQETIAVGTSLNCHHVPSSA